MEIIIKIHNVEIPEKKAKAILESLKDLFDVEDSATKIKHLESKILALEIQLAVAKADKIPQPMPLHAPTKMWYGDKTTHNEQWWNNFSTTVKNCDGIVNWDFREG